MKKKWNEMSSNQKNTIEITVGIIILILFFAFRLISNYISAKNAAEFSKEVHLVTDNSRYYTVIGCIDKYLSTVESGNQNDILLTLNDEYKREYNITSSNLKNFIPKLEKGNIYSYTGEEMYEKRISKNVVLYYIHGKIKEQQFEGDTVKTEYDLTVILYEDKFLFSIRPGVNYEK